MTPTYQDFRNVTNQTDMDHLIELCIRDTKRGALSQSQFSEMAKLGRLALEKLSDSQATYHVQESTQYMNEGFTVIKTVLGRSSGVSSKFKNKENAEKELKKITSFK